MPRYIVHSGVIKPLCDILSSHDNKIILISLEGIENILKSGMNDIYTTESGEVNPYAEMFDQCGGIDKLIDLQTKTDNDKIYEKAKSIMESYFGGVEEEISFELPDSSAENSRLPDLSF